MYNRANQEIDILENPKELTRLVKQGNPDALYSLGIRLLAGEGAPFRPVDGTALPVGAYQKGHANAPVYERQIQTRGQRIITFLLYPNENYQGKETHFPDLELLHKGKAGEGMYFVNARSDGSPDTRTLHAGLCPSSGEKWAVSQFIRNRPAF